LRAAQRQDALSERQVSILGLVQEQGFATIEALAKLFNVSGQTVRREIIRLDELRLLQRFHGGAGLRGDDGGDPSRVRLGYAQKKGVSTEAKHQIAQACATLIRPGSSVFLDVGTTAEAVARALTGHQRLTIVTPNLTAASILAGSGAGDIIVTGGLVRGLDGSLVGEEAISAIRRFRLDWAVIACSGFDVGPDGATTPMDFDLLKVGVKQAMMRQAKRSILIADASKFERSAIVAIAPLAAFTNLVTDEPPPEALARQAAKANCRVVIGGREPS